VAKTVVGLFDDLTEARTVVRELVDAGYPRADIGLIANGDDNDGLTGEDETSVHHTVGEDTVRGAEAGALVGGIAGLLVGLGAFAIPGIGPIVAAGPIAAALAGLGVGAVTGGVMGALIHAGVPEDQAHYYAEGVRRGGTLVTVKADADSADRAVSIFQAHGAVDVGANSNVTGSLV